MSVSDRLKVSSTGRSSVPFRTGKEDETQVDRCRSKLGTDLSWMKRRFRLVVLSQCLDMNQNQRILTTFFNDV